MKTILRLLPAIAFASILFVSCSDDLLNYGSDNLTNDFTKVGSQSVGSEGGLIDLDSIQLSIPAGAFDGMHKIKVYSQPASEEMAEYSLSSTFLIEGLPETVNEPLEVKIRYEGDIIGDTLVAQGVLGHATSLNDGEVFAFEGVPASAEGGYVTVELGGNLEPLKSGGATIKKFLHNQIQLMMLQNYLYMKSSNNHFALVGPRKYRSKDIQLAEYFETAYDTCIGMGFSLDARQWPAKVFFHPLKDAGVCGYYSTYYQSPPTDQGLRNLFYLGNFTINTSIIDDEDELRVTAGHEFLHLVQNLYEFSSPDVEPTQIWLKEASAVWIESKYSTQNNYISSSIYGNENEPFEAWDMASGDHGYGMSVVIKDLADTYGDQAVVKIHEAIRDGNVPDNAVNPMDALIDQLKEPLSNYYHSVMGAYLLGHYYNKQVIKTVWQNQNNIYLWSIDNDVDTLFTLTDTLKDLSSTLIYSNLNYKNITADAEMILQVDDPVNCGLLAGKYKDDTGLELLGEVSPGNGGELRLTGIKDLQDDGYSLILMITNSRFTGKANDGHIVTFTAELNAEAGEGEPPYLDMPDEITIGYYQYYYFTKNTQGYRDTLFFYKLLDPDAQAQAYEAFADGTWMQSFILGGSLFDSLYFNGGSLSGYENVKPGTDIPCIVKAENEYGVCIDTTIVHIGSPFIGIKVLDSAATWYPLYSNIGACYPLGEISPFTASNSSMTGSFKNSNYYTSWDFRGNDTIAKNSVSTNFGVTINGSSVSGSGHLDYYRTKYDTGGDPSLEIHLVTSMTMGNELEGGMRLNQNSPASFSLSLMNSSSSTTETRIWHYYNKPDSTHIDQLQADGGISFEFYGHLDIDYPCWK